MRDIHALLGKRRAAWAGVALFLACMLIAFDVNSAQQRGTGIILEIAGAIGPASADYITRGLQDAADENAKIVILRMDTPGGLDVSMREIIRAILASPIPVATYVAPSGARAASAGTYIAYASHIAAMAPGTNIGAATPVSLGGSPQPTGDGQRQPEDQNGKAGEDKQAPPTVEVKAMNDAIAYIRSLAELRGRNADWAEEAVRRAASLSAEQAAAQDVIDFIARDIDDLLTQANGKTVTVGGEQVTLNTQYLVVSERAPDWRTRILAVITDPNVALMFLMAGIYGLIFEFLSPGAVLPGVAGAISLLTGFYALAILPVTFAGIAFILLGAALMVAEAFTASFGVLGIGGVISFVIGAAVLIDPDALGFQVQWPVVAAIAAASLALSALVLRLAVGARSRPVVTGIEQLLGAAGTIDNWSGSGGYVLVHGEIWKAVSDKPIKPGMPVKIVAVDGLTLRVVPLDKETP